MESSENNRMLQNSWLRQEPSLGLVRVRVGRRGWNVKTWMRDYQPTIIFETREVTNHGLCSFGRRGGGERLPSGKSLNASKLKPRVETHLGRYGLRLESMIMTGTYLFDNHRMPKQPLD
jgi:hypothetical protein